MRASVILAHPYRNSFNHAIFDAVAAELRDQDVAVFAHDLYAERFDPVLSVDELGDKTSKDSLVNAYADEMMRSDLLVFIHPNWWGQPPAMMKGYIDRVIRPPHAYGFEENDPGTGLPLGKLKGKIGIVFNTSNTEENRENNYFHDPLEHIWSRCVFGFCGIEETHRKMFRVISDSTREQREGWLREVREMVRDIASARR